MTSQPMSQCAVCVRMRSAFSVEPFRDGPFCAAFPDGIPDLVYGNAVDHRQPVDGDHGLRWEALDGADFPDWAMTPPA